MQLALAGAGLGLSLANQADATIRCVKPGGGGGCETTITAALSAATAGDTIRVAQGTYTENVDLSKNVVLEGGWNTAFTQRDPATFVTTIRPADQTQSVVSTFGNISDPASSTPVLDGFTITGGRADLGSNHGGGVRLRYTVGTVRNCAISDNRAYLLGGGVWVQGGAPRLENNRIERNQVIDGNGGGVMMENPTGAVLTGNVIADNIAEEPGSLGGGIAMQDGRAVLTDNTIDGNKASSSGSQGRGGGIGVELADELIVRGGAITDNSAALNCQGFGGGIFVTGTTSATVETVRFTSNCGQFGGSGIYTFDTAQYVVAGSLFAGNGGVVVLDDSVDSTAIFRNDTFVGAGSGTGVNAPPDLEFVNNIVTGFATGVGAAPGAVAKSNIFWNNTANTLGFTLDPDTNFFVDPLLDGTQHLSAGSPAIDAGLPADGPYTDVDGQMRPADGGAGYYRFDIGADEAAGEGPDVADLDRGVADLVINGSGNPDSNQNTDWIGYTVMGRDVTGDGLDDLIIAAEDWAQDFNNDLFANGHVFGLFHFGERRTGTIDLAAEPADLELVSVRNNWHFGEGFASADVNADGDRDLIIVAGVQDDGDITIIPTVMVFSGGPGLAGEIMVNSNSPGSFAMRAASGNNGALGGWNGNGLAVGDLNGDGIADIAAAEPGAGTSPAGAAAAAIGPEPPEGSRLKPLPPDRQLVNPRGAVHVVFGESGLAGQLDLATTPADVTILGSDSTHPLRAIATGRLNTGSQLDLVARTGVSAHLLFGPLAAGVRDLAVTPADVTITGLGDPGEVFDQVLVGDATGDAWDDVLLAQGDGDSADRILVFAGPFVSGTQLVAPADAAFVLVAESDISALAFGDVLGDVRPDLVIGLENARRSYVVSPGAAGSGEVQVQDVASMIVAGTTQRRLGWDAKVGDLDGDARGDLIVGTWQLDDPGVSNDANDIDIGRSFVFYGGAHPDNCPGVSNPTQTDTDGDAVGDACDNCRLRPNGNQRDTNGDAFGNTCDPDLNDDGRVNFADLGALKSRFFSNDPDADFNGDGVVNFRDLATMKAFFFGVPGPGAD